MPQASDELRAEMQRLFNDPVDDGAPLRFLKAAGYTLTRQFFWLPKEGVTSYEDMTEDERLCLKFLIDEWDFGAFAP
jgi:hypothetical protein